MEVRGSRAWVVVAAEALLDGSAILPDGMERGPRGVMCPVVRVLPLELLFLRRGGLRVPGVGADRRTDTSATASNKWHGLPDAARGHVDEPLGAKVEHGAVTLFRAWGVLAGDINLFAKIMTHSLS